MLAGKRSVAERDAQQLPLAAKTSTVRMRAQWVETPSALAALGEQQHLAAGAALMRHVGAAAAGQPAASARMRLTSRIVTRTKVQSSIKHRPRPCG